jgi:hypothetical protein
VALEKKTNGIEEQNDAEEGGSGDGSTEKWLAFHMFCKNSWQ